MGKFLSDENSVLGYWTLRLKQQFTTLLVLISFESLKGLQGQRVGHFSLPAVGVRLWFMAHGSSKDQAQHEMRVQCTAGSQHHNMPQHVTYGQGENGRDLWPSGGLGQWIHLRRWLQREGSGWSEFGWAHHLGGSHTHLPLSYSSELSETRADCLNVSILVWQDETSHGWSPSFVDTLQICQGVLLAWVLGRNGKLRIHIQGGKFVLIPTPDQEWRLLEFRSICHAIWIWDLLLYLHQHVFLRRLFVTPPNWLLALP